MKPGYTLAQYNGSHLFATHELFLKNETVVCLIMGEAKGGKLDVVMADHIKKDPIKAKDLLSRAIKTLNAYLEKNTFNQ